MVNLGHVAIGHSKGLYLRYTVCEFKHLTTNKICHCQYSDFRRNRCCRSRSSDDGGHMALSHLKGIFLRNIVCEDEQNVFTKLIKHKRTNDQYMYYCF